MFLSVLRKLKCEQTSLVLAVTIAVALGAADALGAASSPGPIATNFSYDPSSRAVHMNYTTTSSSSSSSSRSETARRSADRGTTTRKGPSSADEAALSAEDKKYFKDSRVDCYANSIVSRARKHSIKMCYRYVKDAESKGKGCGFFTNADLLRGGDQGAAINFMSIASRVGMERLSLTDYPTPESAPPGSILVYDDNGDPKCRRGSTENCTHIEFKSIFKNEVHYTSDYDSPRARIRNPNTGRYRTLVAIYVNKDAWDKTHS